MTNKHLGEDFLNAVDNPASSDSDMEEVMTLFLP